MLNTEFFEPFPTQKELAAYLAAHADQYGDISASQFIKDHLPKEAAFQAKVIKALQTWRDSGLIDKRTIYWKQTAGVYNRNGMPDVMALIEGTLFGFEIKRPIIGSATALQRKTIQALNAAGGYAAIISFPAEARHIITDAGLWKGDPTA